MTHRDLVWRGFGAALLLVGFLIGLEGRQAANSSLSLLAFGLAIFGLVLIVQGKRVPLALKIERGRHRLLAQAIRDRRRGRSGGEG